MIYIFDNITNREKVSFSNALRNVTKNPAFYINYYNPIRELIDASTSNLGMCTFGGDEFLSETEDLSSTSFGDKFKQNKEKIDNFKEKLYKVMYNKITRTNDIDSIIDGVCDKNTIDLLSETYPNITIVKGSLKKDESNFKDDDLKDYNVFEIVIDEKADLSKLEGEIESFISKHSEKVIELEMVTPLLQAA